MTTKTLSAHPLAECYPTIIGPQFKRLVESIKSDGLQSPITVYRDQILDGRCRYAACRTAGVEPAFVEYDGPEENGALVAFVLAANSHRRHLPENQLAIAAAKLAQLTACDAKGPRGPFQKLTQQQAAQAVGASVRSTKRATRVLKNGSPDLIAAAERGEVQLNDAEAISTAPKSRQSKALSKVRAGKSKSLRSAISGGTTFDPVELDAAKSPSKSKGANGKPEVSQRLRKECDALLGKLCRSLSKAGIYDEFVQPLSQIAERLKQI